jgi:hypothetical protein
MLDVCAAWVTPGMYICCCWKLRPRARVDDDGDGEGDGEGEGEGDADGEVSIIHMAVIKS